MCVTTHNLVFTQSLRRRTHKPRSAYTKLHLSFLFILFCSSLRSTSLPTGCVLNFERTLPLPVSSPVQTTTPTASSGFHAKYSVRCLSWWNSSHDGITGAASKGVCSVTKVKWRWLLAAWRPWFSVPCAAAFPPCSWDKAFTVWKWWRHLISLWQLSVTWSAKTSTPGLSTVVTPQRERVQQPRGYQEDGTLQITFGSVRTGSARRSGHHNWFKGLSTRFLLQQVCGWGT